MDDKERAMGHWEDGFPYGIKLEPALPWHDRRGLFKLDTPGLEPRNEVVCQACEARFPLRDLLDGELNENECPECLSILGE